MKDSTIRKVDGFTLIEVMIVVAIIAILASIALPAYNDQIRKSRRTDAQRELVSWAQGLERNFSANGTYLDKDGLCNAGAPETDPAKNPIINFYDFSAVTCTATAFKLKADPKAAQEGDGDQTLDQAGGKEGTWKM